MRAQRYVRSAIFAGGDDRCERWLLFSALAPALIFAAMQSRVSREWQLFFYEVESGSLVLVWHQLGVERLVATRTGQQAASRQQATLRYRQFRSSFGELLCSIRSSFGELLCSVRLNHTAARNVPGDDHRTDEWPPEAGQKCRQKTQANCRPHFPRSRRRSNWRSSESALLSRLW